MPTVSTATIALLGDESSHPSHRELNALVPRLSAELGVDARWVATDQPFDVAAFDGVWLVPGSPYANDGAVYAALSEVRQSMRLPFLGTCGGLQYAVVEYLSTVVGVAATHAESDGLSDDNAVAPLACSLMGESRLVSPVPGTRFGRLVDSPFDGMHYCGYGPTPDAIATLEAAGVLVGATADGTSAEVLEFPGHDFYIASLFQPHIGTSAGAPIHPLIVAFAAAVRAYAARMETTRPQSSDVR